ncbi:response regulator [Ketobacter sp. MCCC 1A13808]|uniref:HD domain-containing phosphohydrolase n=1 Tax=Ketobacter sp. MCCC 1A13808 TaxID=2602738 RepID=UPI0012EC499D|nr:HD domain-containing phosphohydrolase [Ketobacter sp. MCCC 1A13808]MVF12233.1 response regulator [Ketobacter sp. MCCC 1A13808]
MPESNYLVEKIQTLLLVDDEEKILASLTRLLEEEPNVEVLCCGSATEALDLLERQNVDLIISDMRMPVMNGATFLSQAAQRWPDTGRILLTGFSDVQSAIQAINEGKISHYISKPWDDEDLLRRVREVLEVKSLKESNRQLLIVKEEQRLQLQELTERQEAIIKSRTAELEQTASQIEIAYQELQESYFQSVPLLANLIELNERHKKNHAKRVADMTQVLAKEMQVSDHELRQYYIGALLHDIGKIGIEQSILGKSPQEMSPVELKQYQQHPLLGESALLALDPLREAVQIVRCHHERFDGKGFPGKLAGETIPLGARLVAVTNDYDNLQMPNNFLGKALTDVHARDFILQESGRRYDPQIVAIFENAFERIQKLISITKEVVLSLDKAHAGMKLSQDLLNHHGLVMLSAGSVLTENHIRKLTQFEKAFDTRLTLQVHYKSNQT